MKRFWSKVNKTDECWLWTAALNKGYGVIGIDGKTVQAHRWAYQDKYGPITSDVVLMHTCDTPACVNPDHLRPGTHADNVRDCQRKRRTTLGMRNRHAKLTDEEVLEIRKRLINPKRGDITAVAKDFGISQPLASMIYNRRIWKHI